MLLAGVRLGTSTHSQQLNGYAQAARSPLGGRLIQITR